MEIFQPVGIMHLILFMLYFALAVSVISTGKFDAERLTLATLMFCMSVWALCKVVMHNTMTPYPAALFAMDFGMFFNLMIPALLLYFGFVIFYPSRILSKMIIPLLLIILSSSVALFSIKYHLYLLEKGPYGWMAITNPAMVVMYNIFYMGPLYAFFVITVVNAFSKNPLKRGMSLWLGSALLFALSFYIFLPQRFLVSNSADVEALPLLVAFFLSIRRYGLFDLTETQAVNNIFDTMREFLFMTDLKGSITQANGVFTRAFGSVKVIADFFETSMEADIILKKILSDGRYAGFTNVLTESGRMHVSFSATVLKRLNYPVAVVWIITDMTAKKELEDHMKEYGEKLKAEVEARTVELKETEERFRMMFESANDAIFTMRADRIMECNNRAVDLFKCASKKELEGHSVVEYSPEIQPDGVSSAASAKDYIGAALSGEPQRFYWKHRDKSGKLFDADVSLNSISYKGEDFLQAIVRDITERLETSRKVKESEEKFRTLSEQSLLGTFIIQDNVIKYANEGFSKITEYTVEEMLAWPPGRFMEVIVPEYREKVLAQMSKKINNEPGTLESYRVKATAKSGRTGWVEIYGRKVMYGGKPSNMVSVIEVTRQQEAEENMERSIRELKELGMLKQNFIAMVSHEMRTPLITVSGFADILISGMSGPLNEKQKEYMAVIKNNSDRQASLVNNLLDLSKIELGIFTLKKKSVLPETVADAAIQSMLPELTERGIKIIKEYGAAAAAELDNFRISQVIEILLKNAAAHSADNSSITVGMMKGAKKPGADTVMFYVKDSGTGIEPEHLSRLFQQFYQAGSEKSLVDKGAGLGLSLAKYIVEAHGGEIWAESAGIGKGAKFSFAVPVK